MDFFRVEGNAGDLDSHPARLYRYFTFFMCCRTISKRVIYMKSFVRYKGICNFKVLVVDLYLLPFYPPMTYIFFRTSDS